MRCLGFGGRAREIDGCLARVKESCLGCIPFFYELLHSFSNLVTRFDLTLARNTRQEAKGVTSK